MPKCQLGFPGSRAGFLLGSKLQSKTLNSLFCKARDKRIFFLAEIKNLTKKNLLFWFENSISFGLLLTL